MSMTYLVVKEIETFWLADNTVNQPQVFFERLEGREEAVPHNKHTTIVLVPAVDIASWWSVSFH